MSIEKGVFAMVFPDEHKLFTVAEVSRACGISRTSLIRLEECGFLKPCHVDPVTGYRYYDVNNIVEVGRYKRFQAIGLNRNEISDIYHNRIDPDRFIEEQRQRLNEMQRFINEFELSHGHKKYLRAFGELPEMTCCCEDISASSFKELGMAAYKTYEKVIAGGFCVIPRRPPVIISDAWQSLPKDSPSGCRFTVCIPVITNPKQSADARLRHFPASDSISLSGFGAFSILPELIKQLYKETDKRKLKPAGPLRLIVFSASDNPDLEAGNYVYEFIMPVTEQ
ncbi:MAG: MerR family transcriptional regulator [Lachnospiraceae bacterium]|nr:MerR family transcriptional regulator [Lachnospiraceae bacterium]